VIVVLSLSQWNLIILFDYFIDVEHPPFPKYLTFIYAFICINKCILVLFILQNYYLKMCFPRTKLTCSRLNLQREREIDPSHPTFLSI